MLRFPTEFFESVVDTYWVDLDYAGQKLAGAYTDLVTVPPNGQLPLSAQVSRELASKQVNVYLFELIGLFLRKEGKSFIFLDYDHSIKRARWRETKEPPDPASLLRQYFDGLHACGSYRERWLEGNGGGVPSVRRVKEDGTQFSDVPKFDEFLTTYRLSFSPVPYNRPGESELGPTIGSTQVIYLDFMHDIKTGQVQEIPKVLAARDKVAATHYKENESWYGEGESLELDVAYWRDLIKNWIMGREGHEEKPEIQNPEAQISRFCRALLSCFYKISGDDSFLYVYGPGGTGKSLLQNSFSAMLGEYSTEVTRQALCMNNNTGHSSNLLQIYGGARVAIVKEAKNDSGNLDIEQIKDITSFEPGRKYAVRAAYESQPKLYSTAAKPFFVSNDSPQHLLDSAGIDRRLVAVPFLSRFVQSGVADRLLPEKLITPRYRTALLWCLLEYVDEFLDKGSVPLPGENQTESESTLYDTFMDLFKYRNFLTDSAFYEDSVTTKDLIQIRAFKSRCSSVQEFLNESGITKHRCTKDSLQCIRDLVGASCNGNTAYLGEAKGGVRTVIHVALTEKGRKVLNEAREALSDF